MSKRTRKPKSLVIDEAARLISLTNKVDGLNDLVLQQSQRITVLETQFNGFVRDYQAHLHEIRLISGPKQFSVEIDRMIQEQRAAAEGKPPPPKPSTQEEAEEESQETPGE